MGLCDPVPSSHRRAVDLPRWLPGTTTTGPMLASRDDRRLRYSPEQPDQNPHLGRGIGPDPVGWLEPDTGWHVAALHRTMLGHPSPRRAGPRNPRDQRGRSRPEDAEVEVEHAVLEAAFAGLHLAAIPIRQCQCNGETGCPGRLIPVRGQVLPGGIAQPTRWRCPAGRMADRSRSLRRKDIDAPIARCRECRRASSPRRERRACVPAAAARHEGTASPDGSWPAA